MRGFRFAFLLLILWGHACIAQQTFPQGYSFYDDFEIGGTDEWTYTPDPYMPPTAYIGTQNCSGSGGTYAVSTTQPHSGIYSLAETVSTAGAEDCSIITSYATANPLYTLFYFYLAPGFTVSNGNAIVLEDIANAGFASQYYIEILNSSGLKLNTTCGSAGTHTLTTGAWHSVSLVYNSSAQTATVTLDGTTEISGSSCSLGASPIYIREGVQQFAGVASGTIYFDDVIVSSSSVTASSANMVVRHSPTFGRTALPIDVTMWGATNGDTLAISMDGTQQATNSISGQQANVIFTCCTSYSAGSHTVLVQDKTGSTVNSSWTETITAYNSSFPVSIDGYNNIVDGSGVFPITPFIGDFGVSGSNQFYYGFWFPTYATVNGWVYQGITAASDFAANMATQMSDSEVQTLGPDYPSNGLTGCPACTYGGSFPSGQNTFISTTAAALASNTNLFMYSWQDEPNFQTINGSPITQAITANWDSLTHAADTNHLVALNTTGTTPAYLLTQNWWNPLSPIGEVLSMDNYPVQSQCGGSPITIATWVAYVQQFIRDSFSLYPWGFFLESSAAGGSMCNATGNQLRMEAWLATIHGAKMIEWFVAADGASGTSSDQLTGMAAFKTLSQTSSVLYALTSPAVALTVSSNQTAVGTRVDALVKQSGTTITVFGQRLTDIGESDSGLSTTLTVSGCSVNGTATVVGESRTVSVSNCAITDTFNAYDTHVYQFSSTGISGSSASPGITLSKGVSIN